MVVHTRQLYVDLSLGTPVGDPIEFESIRSTFSVPERTERLFIGSVKDNIGHAEAASGAAGVIKTLLMIQHGVVPKQANFVSLNPRINSSPSDRITVPKETGPWNASRRIALINNYGAAGSNAAIVVRQHDKDSEAREVRNGVSVKTSPTTYPILLSARSASSLHSYASALKSHVSKHHETSLSDLAYNISRRQNPSFEHRIAFTVSDREHLLSKLEESGSESALVTKSAEKRPVVLCFGGQTGLHANISRELYDESVLLRKYLVS
jgi:acyl transferase domain-containing protein